MLWADYNCNINTMLRITKPKSKKIEGVSLFDTPPIHLQVLSTQIRT